MSDRADTDLDALFIAELNERLFVHFTQTRWSAPLSDRLCPVMAFDGDRMGRIACGDTADVRRAITGLRGAGDSAPALQAAFAPVRDWLVALRAREGFADPVEPPVPAALPPGDGPLILLSAAATPVGVLAGLLIAGAARGMLWKPAPRAAASAHLLMRALGPAAGGGLALVQGDHRTGALLGGQGALVWASGAPVPAGLGPAALSLSARVPHRP